MQDSDREILLRIMYLIQHQSHDFGSPYLNVAKLELLGPNSTLAICIVGRSVKIQFLWLDLLSGKESSLSFKGQNQEIIFYNLDWFSSELYSIHPLPLGRHGQEEQIAFRPRCSQRAEFRTGAPEEASESCGEEKEEEEGGGGGGRGEAEI